MELSIYLLAKQGNSSVRFRKFILTVSRVAVRVSCEVTAPYPDRKFDGIFNISCEFSPMMSPAFEAGR
jgi:exosome complex RNA-binding protein Rrp42 (RNase PH superfamily)